MSLDGDELSGVYDVVVVGSGIMGSCTAFELAKRGKSVLLLEQFDFLHRRGSSHGESRTIRITYSQDYYVEMMIEAYKLWEDIQREAGYAVYDRTGQLDFGPRQSEELAAVLSSLQKFKIDYEVWSPAQVSQRFPMLQLPENWYAVYTAQGGTIRASKAVAMFQALAAKHGATLRDRAKVLTLSRADNAETGVVVTTSKGTAIGSKIVLACGAWTAKLVKDFSGIELPIQPLHTNNSYWSVQEQHAHLFTPTKGFPVFASYSDPHVYGTPSIEYPGMIKVNYDDGYACDPDNRTVAPDIETLTKTVSPWLASFFKGYVKWEAPVIAEGCMYSMTPDHNYILDHVPGRDGMERNDVLVTAGFSGHGFKMGPLIGRIMADLALTGNAVGLPLEHFSIKRFKLNSP